MSLIKPLVKDKKCGVCRTPMVHQENGKLNHVWICPQCGNAETLSVIGKWHPAMERHVPR